MHEFDYIQQDLQSSDIPVEPVPEVNVLHLREGNGRRKRSGQKADRQMTHSVRAAHLHRHRSPVVELRLVNLSQAGRCDGLVVEGLEKLLGGFVEVLQEESVHLFQSYTLNPLLQNWLSCLCSRTHLLVPPV